MSARAELSLYGSCPLVPNILYGLFIHSHTIIQQNYTKAEFTLSRLSAQIYQIYLLLLCILFVFLELQTSTSVIHIHIISNRQEGYDPIFQAIPLPFSLLNFSVFAVSCCRCAAEDCSCTCKHAPIGLCPCAWGSSLCAVSSCCRCGCIRPIQNCDR